MKLLIWIFILVSLFAQHIFAADQKVLLILGDSITEGYGVAQDKAYPAVLEQKIKDAGKNWKVINSGVSGSTTASALPRMKWAFKAKPDLVLLVLGANDGLRGLPVSEAKKNLSEAIKYAQSQHVKIILAGLYMPPNYGKKYTGDFKKMFKELSNELHVPLLPFILENVAGRSELNQSDGIHPNEKGHAIVAETVFQFLKKDL